MTHARDGFLLALALASFVYAAVLKVNEGDGAAWPWIGIGFVLLLLGPRDIDRSPWG